MEAVRSRAVLVPAAMEDCDCRRPRVDMTATDGAGRWLQCMGCRGKVSVARLADERVTAYEHPEKRPLFEPGPPGGW